VTPETGSDSAVGDSGSGTDAAHDAANDTAACTAGACCGSTHLTIAEVKSRGSGGASDEYVEIYNPTPAPVTLDASWALQARSTTTTTYTTRWVGTGQVLPPYSHFLVVGSAYVSTPAGDAALTSGISDAASVTLVQGGTPVDALCFGYDTTTINSFDATYACNGTPVNNAPHNNTTSGNVDMSLDRLPDTASGGNCQNTQDNAADFEQVMPSDPQNLASAPSP
jgi:hypothetical protein